MSAPEHCHKGSQKQGLCRTAVHLLDSDTPVVCSEVQGRCQYTQSPSGNKPTVSTLQSFQIF